MKNELEDYATFKPILVSNDANKEEIWNYYKDNNLQIDNPFLENYLTTPTSSPISNDVTKKTLDIREELNRRNIPTLTHEETMEDINTNTAIPNPKAPLKDKAKRMINHFVKKGWSKEIASGIVGNLYAESGLNHLRPQNNGGPGFGLAQWEHPRRNDFKRIIGKDIKDSTEEEQLNFIDWELRNTERGAGLALKNAKTAVEAASIFAKRYERMKVYNREREDYASQFYNY